MNRRSTDIAHYAVLMPLAVALAFLAASCVAHGAPCRACARPLVQHVAPLQQVVSPVLYRVGAQLEGESVDTYAFRRSPEFLELLQRRAFDAGVLAGRGDAAYQTQRVEAEGKAQPQAAAEPDGETDSPADGTNDDDGGTNEPAGETAGAFRETHPTLAANCLRCHTGEEPKGDVWIDGSDPIDDDEAAAMARAIVNERMPKGKPLDAQGQYDALVDIFQEPGE